MVFDLGPATVPHEEVIRMVQPVVSHVHSKRGVAPTRVESPGRQHLLSYVALTKHHGLHLTDKRNARTEYVDLNALNSASIFINSPTKRRGTSANVAFETYRNSARQLCLRIVALRSIQQYEELLYEYFDFSTEYLEKYNSN